MTDTDPLIADFAERMPDSFSRLLARGSAGDVSALVAQLPPHVSASIVSRLPATHVLALLDSPQHDPARWLIDAPFSDAVSLLSRIPRERRLALVNSLDSRQRRQQLLRHWQYPKHSLGWLIRDVPMRIAQDEPAEDVLQQLRGTEREDPGLLVVVDSNGNYVGLLDLWSLITRHPPVGRIGDYVQQAAPLHPETPIDSVVGSEGWLRHNWLPVVDHRRRVLGGVSRQALNRAARIGNTRPRRAADILVDLLAELVYLLGALVDTVVGRRRPS